MALWRVQGFFPITECCAGAPLIWLPSASFAFNTGHNTDVVVAGSLMNNSVILYYYSILVITVEKNMDNGKLFIQCGYGLVYQNSTLYAIVMTRNVILYWYLVT